ncbi:hypothetical protein HCZ23_16835 [Celeribacter sp. HF31]|uniref:hypothetical protein n=1 Tax=Celeribacter sp. HF31 TaxID=2721558 RepID=UPI00142F4201|nr:hypothetical protein [Celeribacter sp. HF31]NIY81129.1 hypothetical protein [Celeribacter sp. HF31]
MADFRQGKGDDRGENREADPWPRTVQSPKQGQEGQKKKSAQRHEIECKRHPSGIHQSKPSANRGFMRFRQTQNDKNKDQRRGIGKITGFAGATFFHDEQLLKQVEHDHGRDDQHNRMHPSKQLWRGGKLGKK